MIVIKQVVLDYAVRDAVHINTRSTSKPVLQDYIVLDDTIGDDTIARLEPYIPIHVNTCGKIVVKVIADNRRKISAITLVDSVFTVER